MAETYSVPACYVLRLTDCLLVPNSDVSPTLKCQRSTALRLTSNLLYKYPEHDIWSNIDNRSDAAADGRQRELNTSSSLNNTAALEIYGPVSDGFSINDPFDTSASFGTADDLEGAGISASYQHDMNSWQELDFENFDFLGQRHQSKSKETSDLELLDSTIPRFVFPSSPIRRYNSADLNLGFQYHCE